MNLKITMSPRGDLFTKPNANTKILAIVAIPCQDEDGRAATDSLYISAMNARVAILTGEIAAARAEMANQAELANRAMRKSEEFKAQIAAVTSQNAKLKTRHLTQVNHAQ